MRPSRIAAAAALVAALLVAPSVQAGVSANAAALQVALKARGLYAGPIDGIAGPQTKRSVRKFQRRNGLLVDGIAGPQTRRALGRLGRPSYGARPMRLGMVGWDVSALQFRLARRGVGPGGIDGRFGPRTDAAVRRFQRRVGLSADGIAGPATRRALARRAGSGATRPQTVRALLNYWARYYGMSPRFIRALAWVESGWQPHVVSPAGAFGVMQVTPATWRFVETVLVGHRIARTTSGNIRVGVLFIRHLYREFRGNVRLTLGAYNQGPRSVRQHGLFRETRRFVANVLAMRGRI